MRLSNIILTATLTLSLPACAAPVATTPGIRPQASPTAVAEATPQQAGALSESPLTSPISPLSLTAAESLALDSGRSVSVLAAYPIAEATARRWAPDARFLGIEPSSKIAAALSGQVTRAGWFFHFGRAQDKLEYYVQIVDGEVGLVAEAQAATASPAIAIAAIKVDSTRARDIYAGVATTPIHDARLDYALTVVDGRSTPVWYVYDLDRGESPAAMIDATTGELIGMH